MDLRCTIKRFAVGDWVNRELGIPLVIGGDFQKRLPNGQNTLNESQLVCFREHQRALRDAILPSCLSWFANKRSRKVSIVKKRPHDDLPSENRIRLTAKFLQGVSSDGDLTQLDGVGAFDKDEFVIV